MANFDKHAEGTFCWPELSTSNWKEGKAFYTQLFGWGFDDQPIEKDAFYTMLQLEGLDIAAMYQMNKSQIECGVPSSWLNYIAVKSVDLMTLKARELGADVICGPMTVGDAGKMVLLCEPDGAMFALWQGEKHPGAKKLKEHRAMHWNELVTRNAAKSKAFYCGLFDWKTKVEIKSGMTYTLFFNVEQDSPVAGMLEMTKEWSEEVSAQWMIYFSVSDCDEYVAKTEELGGDVCVSATDIPGVGRFSVLMDPQGAVFSIIKSEMTKS